MDKCSDGGGVAMWREEEETVRERRGGSNM